MNLEEHAAKHLLREAGIAIPAGGLATSPDEARELAAAMGPVVVKAQVAAGKRGKAGGVRVAATADEAAAAAEAILGLEIEGQRVERLLVEARVEIAQELYAAVVDDSPTGSPLVLFSAQGGMDIEELAARAPGAVGRASVDIAKGFSEAEALALISGLAVADAQAAIVRSLAALYRLYIECDAELVEINPLAVSTSGEVIALDCKLVVDDSALPRQPDLAAKGTPEPLTELEARAEAQGLKYIELDGDIGVLANGAGLTMTTMDVVAHYGGRPANFLEIGGQAYTKAVPALELVIGNPRVKSLVVNFCGAFARCDVMAEGVIEAWLRLKPELPVFFSIHGTGEEAAIQMVRDRLGLEPYDRMDDAIKAAIEAAERGAA
ncbi:MAG: succinate--CoA ligase subunit beta [Kiloniellales bacterium]